LKIKKFGWLWMPVRDFYKNQDGQAGVDAKS
jgi:hypothetical protein